MGSATKNFRKRCLRTRYKRVLELNDYLIKRCMELAAELQKYKPQPEPQEENPEDQLPLPFTPVEQTQPEV